ncbi:hypothetical protein ACFS5L_36370 [Streptomyces phyllanthi]|uniref:Uncharacterized protein n=1 Tax=Streptomyces phyllanthi TaxID=1803180 RepID=A0A5N8WH16_9ACTN|nr:hypothetical protein [Streptomyces phyllanthi]MPY46771.1 hypothetical protein [Streptomyces phyllanthi]
MASTTPPYDPDQVRLTAAQQAQRTTASVLAAQLPKLKAEWIKDVQATAVKSDFQAAALSSQFFKMDHSLFKWDEKGFTFAGKQIGPNFSLQGLIHGRSDKAEKAAKKVKDAQEAQAAEEARKKERQRVEKFEDELKRHVRNAQTTARHAQDDARKAQADARRADNLLRSASGSARLAADNATRANQALTSLEKRVKTLEGSL